MVIADLAHLNIPWRVVLAVGLATVLLFLIVHGIWVSLTRRRLEFHERHGWFSRFFYTIFVIATAILAATAFGSISFFGHMFGYALLLHVTAAGAFVIALLFVAMHFLPWGGIEKGQPGALEHRWWLARYSAWGLVVASLLAAGTMLVSMLPLPGTNQLLVLAQLHRIAGFIAVLALILHLYAMCITRVGWR